MKLLKDAKFSAVILFSILGALLVVGFYFVTLNKPRASAQLGLPADPQTVILNMHHEHGHGIFYENKLSDWDTDEFTLYRNGLLLCGSKIPAVAKKTFEIKRRTLSETEMQSLLDQVQGAGFLNLTERYPANLRGVPVDGISVALISSTLTKTVVYGWGAKPDAFKNTEKIMEDNCKSASEIYRPEKVRVDVRKVNAGDPATTETEDVWNGQRVSSTRLVNQMSNQALEEFSGSDATEVIEQFGGNTKKNVRVSGVLYEFGILPVIPDPAPLQSDQEGAEDGESDGATSFWKKLFGVSDTIAGGDYKVQFVWFYASDQTLNTKLDDNRDKIASAVKSFYTNKVGKSFDTIAATTIKGSHSSNYYQTHCPNGGSYPDDCPDKWGNVLFNLSDEYAVSGRIRIFITQIKPYSGSGCGGGVATKGGNFGVTFNAASQSCWDSSSTKSYFSTSAAHELGHNFGLARTSSAHRSDGSVMDQGACGYFSSCYLNSTDKKYLYWRSRYFDRNPVKTEVSGTLGSPSVGNYVAPGQLIRYRVSVYNAGTSSVRYRIRDQIPRFATPHYQGSPTSSATNVTKGYTTSCSGTEFTDSYDGITGNGCPHVWWAFDLKASSSAYMEFYVLVNNNGQTAGNYSTSDAISTRTMTSTASQGSCINNKAHITRYDGYTSDYIKFYTPNIANCVPRGPVVETVTPATDGAKVGAGEGMAYKLTYTNIGTSTATFKSYNFAPAQTTLDAMGELHGSLVARDGDSSVSGTQYRGYSTSCILGYADSYDGITGNGCPHVWFAFNLAAGKTGYSYVYLKVNKNGVTSGSKYSTDPVPTVTMTKDATIGQCIVDEAYSIITNPTPDWSGKTKNSPSNCVADKEAPTTPSNLRSTEQTATSIKLDWNASTDNVSVVGYKIFRNGAHVGTVTSGTSYTNSGLASSTTYTFYVIAYDAAGNNSAQSTTISVSTK